ncbi:sensor histidine kinase [Peredibacter sp. HCB2-198]|uniref:sensor histidine kinase n=1 Tax=Peredibacter sp. HCB2-198 TaxID=3383025 RepID=UPI0038B5DB52
MKSHFKKSVKKLEWMTALSVSLSFIIICSIFYIIDSYRKFNEISSLMRPNFSYWMAVGDSFQVNRAILNIDKGSSLKIWVKSDNFSAGDYIGKELIRLSDNFSIRFNEGKLLVSKKSILNSFSGEQLGEFYLSGNVPFTELFIILLALIFVSKVLVSVLLKEIMKFSNNIISPLKISLVGTEITDAKFNSAKIEEKWNILAEALETQKHEIDSVKKLKKTTFVAQQIAHDVKSPLSVLETAISLLNIQDENLLKIIRLSFERINSTVLDLENIQDNEGLIPGLVKLNDVIQEICHEKRLEFFSRENLEIQSVVNPMCDYSYANSIILKRILSNLINNAVESTKEKIRITVSLMSYGESNYIFINDTGPGMSDEVLNRVFVKGFTYGKSKGSGLGLYHAEQTLLNWNGKISISSRVGVGTSVVICLPKTYSSDSVEDVSVFTPI